MNSKYFSLLLILILLSGCSKDGDVNFFSIQDDKDFGSELKKEILSNPSEYPIVDESINPEPYQYIRGMMNQVLESEDIYHSEEFNWEVYIIDRKDIINAFAAPGGKLFFYTGLIDYLNSGAELAGVMAHEVAHSDRRHSTETLTKQYGLSILLSILLGDNPSKLEQIAGELALATGTLQFSQKHEYEADEYSVRYLASVKNQKNYRPGGILGFFNKLKENGQWYSSDENPIHFMRTHPPDDKRVDNINTVLEELNNPTGNDFTEEYNNFKNALGL
jgi:predicted Zn-dependent protease